jgi:putative ABC transport system substrate-binding protein
MRRRELILGLVAAFGVPAAARAQEKRLPVIGYISGGSASFYASILPAFRDGLHEKGYVEGQNVRIEYRWAEGRYDRLPAFAAEFVARKVDLIMATGGDAASLAAQKATASIPIVFTSGSDPVADGRVASLARPGGNLTGDSFLTIQLHPKRLELISEMVPSARVVALLVNPNAKSTARVVREVGAAADQRHLRLKLFEATGEADFDRGFAELESEKVGAVIVETDPFIDARHDRLVALAARYAVPAIYGFRQFVQAGGLMSYGVSITGVYRQAGVYAARILRGEKPADLPVQQPTKFEFAINLKTAKALGLKVPPLLMAQADEVIE